MIKKVICVTVMEVLYRAVRFLAAHDTRVMREIASLEAEQIISFAISPDENSPRLTFTIKNGTIKKVKSDKYDLNIVFKNLSSAFLIFTGQMSVAQGYAAHALYLYGSINYAIGVVRIVDIAESCLFPRIITKRILTHVYKREVPMLLTYLALPFYG